MPSVYVKTMGCKVNTFDSHVIQNQFKGLGYDLQEEPLAPDITVVNTCSVTAQADREARYLARRIKRDFPSTLLVFTGCYAQTDSARLASMDEIDLVIPNEGKESLVQWVTEGFKNRQGRRMGFVPGMGDAKPEREEHSDQGTGTSSDGDSQGTLDASHQISSTKIPPGLKPVAENRQEHFKSSLTLFDRADSHQTRAFVKVQDGCNGFCSYCLIPYARGQSRSVPHGQVMDEIDRLLERGVYEIVLTGIHIGDYGRDGAEEPPGGQDPIVPLVEDILSRPGLGRLRISSLEPVELTEDLLAAFVRKKERVCSHFHLPLQSGSDEILKKMRRTYNKDGYRAAVERARRFDPNVCLGADVIPGFPGETDAQFEETLQFIQDLGLSYLHVFPYSRRPNTSAAKMPGHLEGALVAERAKRLRTLSRELWLQYCRKFIGSTLEVLWESDQDPSGRALGRTANYLRVAAAGAPDQGDPRVHTPRQGERHQVLIKGFVQEEDKSLSGESFQGATLLGRIVSHGPLEGSQVR